MSSLAQISSFIGFAALLFSPAAAFPQHQKRRSRGGNGVTKQQTAQQQAAQIPQGVSQATDGSVILDQTVNIKYANHSTVSPTFC
jgi:hypothetical protein